MASTGQVQSASRHEVIERLIEGGVVVEDEATTYIDANVKVGKGTVIRPLTFIEGATEIGEDCVIGPAAQIRDCQVGDRCVIGSSTLDGSTLGDEVMVGQYARIRPGCILEIEVSVGTHAELKNSRVGTRTKINHFSTILDADLGARVNIGAGTVTCNFDGQAKHRTVIGNDAFIGSGTMLVAPVAVGDRAYVGAGSVITEDVPAGALALERSQQKNIPDWVKRRLEKRKDVKGGQ
jgi:bifunctional UDP-N-acetylglucosamine pyrophosphorylase/glucosamine-1-phosphate N-acetyltransferase